MKNRKSLYLPSLLACFAACSGNGENTCSSLVAGCACNAAIDKDVCLQGTALVCVNDRWTSVVDGPCMPGLDAQSWAPSDSGAETTSRSEVGGEAVDGGDLCYSPSSNLSLAGRPGAVGCACNHAVDQDVCVGGKGLMCINSSWTSVFDGPCMPSDAATDQNPADAAMERGSSEAGTKCGDAACQSGEYCVPGCIGTCYCPPAPDSGVCPNGPCNCGAGVGCAYASPSYCSPTVPVGCQHTDAGILCVCA